MTTEEMLSRVDHTQLKAFATWEDIVSLCDEAVEFHTASVCVPPCYVKRIHDTYGDKVNICTVIGFPNGYCTPEVKVFETEDAIRDGADEIDMVINLGWVKDRRWDDLLAEIRAVAADGVLAEIFQIPAGTPLLNMDEVDYDIDGNPVFCSMEYFADGYFRHAVMRKKL